MEEKNNNTTISYYANFMVRKETSPDSLVFMVDTTRPKKSGWYTVTEVNPSLSHGSSKKGFTYPSLKYPLYYNATHDEWTTKYNPYGNIHGTKTGDIPTKSLVTGFSTDDKRSTKISYEVDDLSF